MLVLEDIKQMKYAIDYFTSFILSPLEQANLPSLMLYRYLVERKKKVFPRKSILIFLLHTDLGTVHNKPCWWSSLWRSQRGHSGLLAPGSRASSSQLFNIYRHPTRNVWYHLDRCVLLGLWLRSMVRRMGLNFFGDTWWKRQVQKM